MKKNNFETSYEAPLVECIMEIPSEQMCFSVSEVAFDEDSEDLYFNM